MKDKTLLIEGADAAIVGYIERCGQVPIVVYDYEKLIEVFREKFGGADESEVIEYIEFNILGAWMGNGTPAVLIKATRQEIQQMLQ